MAESSRNGNYEALAELFFTAGATPKSTAVRTLSRIAKPTVRKSVGTCSNRGIKLSGGTDDRTIGMVQ
jgi:hypothetical protein